MCTSMTPTRGGSIAFLLVVLAATFRPLESSPQCDHYGGCRGSYPFLPAAPGKTPSCAKPGSTSCDKLEHYPMQLIRYLIEKWGYDFNSLLSDEGRDNFYSRWTPRPFTPIVQPSYSYGPPPPSYNKVVPSYTPYTRTNYTNMYGNNNNNGGGYPASRGRYKPQQPSTPFYPSTYFSSLLPTQYTPSDNWWNRYSRSVENKQRSKRQAPAPNGATQLCPTTSAYIMPRAALNNKGNWMYVVNLNEVDDKYTQLVRSESCASSQCNGLCTIPNGYTSSCQQQYVQKRLVALEGSGDRLYSDVFWFPHCCICQIVPVN